MYYLFTGKEKDSSGLYYYGARYYDPELGRFISADTFLDGLNRYTYVHNNPVRYIDPNGFLARDENGDIIFTPIGQPILAFNDPKNPAVMQPGIIRTDNGDPIVALKNLSNDKRYNTDCHGVTFADGDYWINNDQVEDILEGDNYKEQDEPEVGDVVIYEDKDGIVHSATVVDVDEETGKVKVSGLGGLDVEVHVDDVEDAWPYPADYTFYSNYDEPETYTDDTTSVNDSESSNDNSSTEEEIETENTDSEDSNSNEGGTVICTELYRQGLMDSWIYEADAKFGEYLNERSPEIMIGSHFLARPVVYLMKESKIITHIVNIFAKPWSYEMAHRIGAKDTGDIVGKIIMFIGIPYM